MTPLERKHLQKLDDLVLHASFDELKKLQEIDYQTQMDGLSLYEIYLDSNSLVNQGNQKYFRTS